MSVLCSLYVSCGIFCFLYAHLCFGLLCIQSPHPRNPTAGIKTCIQAINWETLVSPLRVREHKLKKLDVHAYIFKPEIVNY